ncbi:anti-sigma factor [Nitrospira sp. KM1]|uniref:anti-sigma factor family protein n=1 Tax=Nitrospira sp. KM1 TaxID=1936990 RepID=UPI001563658C|nr:zf-HC2 domain-containing protein [Nitrospira sp. KM1]
MKRPRKTSGRTPRQVVTAVHSPEAGRCLDILRRLSAFIDDELPAQICKELRHHLGACPSCEVFIASLRATVTLCRHCPTPQLTAQDRARLRLEVLNASRPRTKR